MAKSSEPAYQLKVSLEGFKPPIWRRLIISSDATYFDLHSLIQDAFGWEDYHLHSFRIRRNRSKKRIYIQAEDLNEEYRPHFEPPNMPEWMLERQDEFYNELSTTLSQFLNPEFPALVYEYDFGDSWRHEIKLQKVLDRYPKPLPAITTGERQAPPEDSRVWVDEAEEIITASKDKRSSAWKRLVEEWGIEALTDIVEMSSKFLAPFEPTNLSITNPDKRRKNYEE